MRNLHFPYPRRRKERGIIAAEFAAALPVVLSVFMVMMFLIDLMMVKQEITNIGHSAMRECTQIPNVSPAALGACVMNLVAQTQDLAGSNNRYTCEPNPGEFLTTGGTTVQVINLNCTYEGFAPIRAILDLTEGDVDLGRFVNLSVPVFFPN